MGKKNMLYQRSETKICQPNMGLMSWKHAPDGKILKGDVSIGKNYLSEAHISELNQLVSAYLDLAENDTLTWLPVK